MKNINENIAYYVNEEARTVVAVLNMPFYIIAEELENISRKVQNKGFLIIPSPGLLSIKGVYRGKAVCHPDDKFDVEVGKKCAKLRALEAYHKDKLQYLKMLEDAFDELEDRVEDAVDYSKNAIKYLKREQEKLNKEDEDASEKAKEKLQKKNKPKSKKNKSSADVA